MILGDNGNIFGWCEPSPPAVPDLHLRHTAPARSSRATVVLLDYTPGGNCGKYSLVGTDRAKPTLAQGTCTDIGGGDLLHGEGGDDVIHGKSGNDVLFGEGQDDDLYGGAGNDRIYGGAGEDGILGDDGWFRPAATG